MFERIIIRLVLVSFFLISAGPLPNASAQILFELPAPGTMVEFSPKFNQAILKGIIFHPQNPFTFDFILDEGDADLNEKESKEQSQRIATYFLASLTTPEKEIWVNLSPFEKSRIVPTSFGNTLMGQNLLAQDYMLKQIMATALYPERQLGHEFWKKVYTQALIKFGTTNITFNTFNKVWIVPDQAAVYENMKMNAVFVAKSSLKVMLEKDYLAQTKHQIESSIKDTMSSAVIKELVIPALEKEVNEGKNFAPLRQVYNALILAKWYKENLRDNVIAKGYVDRNKIMGVDSQDKQLVSQIYRQYLKAYRKGVFNFIKDDYDQTSQSMVPRKYFSGGFMGEVHVTKSDRAMSAAGFSRSIIASVLLTVATTSEITPALAQAQQRNPTLQANPVPVMSAQDAALWKMMDTSVYNQNAVEFAISIVRMSPRGDLDKAFNDLPNSSAGVGVTLNSPGPNVWSLPIQLSAAGIVETVVNGTDRIRSTYNVGSPTKRMKAAMYLQRIANKIPRSDFLGKVFGLSVWASSKVDNEPDPTVRAARLILRGALIKAGVEDRELIGSNIAGLDSDFKALQSDNWLERWSALAEVENIQRNDPDNIYQGRIAQAIEHSSGRDIAFVERLAKLAIKHAIPALPGIMQSLENYFKTPISGVSGIIELRNRNMYMPKLVQDVVTLADGDRNLLLRSFEVMNGNLTAEGSTELVNSFQLGLYYRLYQLNKMSKSEFVQRLNALRGSELGPVSADDIPNVRQSDINVDTGSYLVRLKTDTDMDHIDQTVQNIIGLGGPVYIPYLLQEFGETDNVLISRSIVKHLKSIIDLGVYSRNNPWTAAIKVKLEDSRRPIAMSALRGLVDSKTSLKGPVLDTLAFTYRQKNPAFNQTEIGQTNTFYETIALTAQVIVNSKMNKSELTALIRDTPGTDDLTGGTLISDLLQNAIDAVNKAEKEGKKGPEVSIAALTALQEAGALDWSNAEKKLLDYIRGDGGVSSIQAAQVLEAAYQIKKSPTDQGSGDAIIRKYITEYHNPEDMKKWRSLFAAFQNKNIKYDWLSKLLVYPPNTPRFPQVDAFVLEDFKNANGNQQLRVSSQMLDTYLYYFNNRKIADPKSLQVSYDMAEKLRAMRDVLKEAIDNYISQENDPIKAAAEKRALKGLLVTAAPYAQYPNDLYKIFDPNTSGDELKAVLDSMSPLDDGRSRVRFPSSALDDLLPALHLDKFTQEPDFESQLMVVIADAQTQLGAAMGANAYQAEALSQKFLEQFRKPESADTQAEMIKSFLSAPPDTTARLYLEGVRGLKDMYPHFFDDLQQRNNFKNLLKTLRYYINEFKESPNEIDQKRYNSIIKIFREYLKQKSTVARFDLDYNIVYIFAQSMDPDLVKSIDLGIIEVPDRHFLEVPDQPLVTLVDYKKEFAHAYAELGRGLNLIKAQIGAYRRDPPSTDLLDLFGDLLDSSKPLGQMAAMEKLGKFTVLVQNNITIKDPRVATFLLYLNNQYIINIDDPRVMPKVAVHDIGDSILLVALDAKRGQKGWIQAQEELSNLIVKMDELKILKASYFRSSDTQKAEEELLSALIRANELIYQTGLRAEAGMVKPLLTLFIKPEFSGSNPTLWSNVGHYNHNALGQSIEYAISNMAKRNPQVNSEIDVFKNNFAPELTGNSIIKTKLDGLKSGDQAMISVPLPKGGIDLEGVNVQSKNAEDIKTANDDQAQLSVLIKSDGLVPVIENVRPLSQPAINQLLGII